MLDMNNNAQEVKIDWGVIVRDMVILMCCMGLLGYLCNLAMKPFEKSNVTDSLVSVIRKGAYDAKTGQDPAFLKELENGERSTPGFVNVADHTGRTPLMWASYANLIDPVALAEKDRQRLYYVDVLLAKPGIAVGAKDENGFTALHWAAWSGLSEVAERYLDRGLDVDEPESHGYTPLMLAAMRGNASTVEALLRRGANVSLKNDRGETAGELAVKHESDYSSCRSPLLAMFGEEGALFYRPIYSVAREKSNVLTLEAFHGSALSASQTGELGAAQDATPREPNPEQEEKNVLERQMEEVNRAAESPAETTPDEAPSAFPMPDQEEL